MIGRAEIGGIEATKVDNQNLDEILQERSKLQLRSTKSGESVFLICACNRRIDKHSWWLPGDMRQQAHGNLSGTHEPTCKLAA
jgi:hypothetical protein